MQIISDPGQRDGGVLDALGNLVRAMAWDEVSIGTQMLGAMRQDADTLAGNVSRGSIERGLSGTRHGLSRESHQCMGGRLMHDCWQRTPFAVIAHQNWL